MTWKLDRVSTGVSVSAILPASPPHGGQSRCSTARGRCDRACWPAACLWQAGKTRSPGESLNRPNPGGDRGLGHELDPARTPPAINDRGSKRSLFEAGAPTIAGDAGCRVSSCLPVAAPHEERTPTHAGPSRVPGPPTGGQSIPDGISRSECGGVSKQALKTGEIACGVMLRCNGAGSPTIC